MISSPGSWHVRSRPVARTDLMEAGSLMASAIGTGGARWRRDRRCGISAGKRQHPRWTERCQPFPRSENSRSWAIFRGAMGADAARRRQAHDDQLCSRIPGNSQELVLRTADADHVLDFDPFE
jgi:hypothetical protein